MAVNLSPVAGAAAQFFDNSGQVLTGGKLYTYTAGTTTPAVTYTTSSGITAHPNPIILNAAGRVPDSGEIWLSDSISYKFVLKDTNDVLIATYDNLIGINSNFVNFTGEEETQVATQGQTVFTLTTIQYQPSTNNLLVFVNGSKQVITTNYIETSSTVITFVDGLNVGDVVDFCTAVPINSNITTANSVAFTGFKGQTGNVQNLAGNNGADWIGFLPATTNAVARSAQDKMRDAVSIKDFNAIGNGIADDTVAIQNAINSLTTGGSLFFPAGTYYVTGLSLTNGQSLTFVGQGAQIKITADVKAFTLTNCDDIEFNGIRVIGNSYVDYSKPNQMGLFLDGVSRTRVINCRFDNLTTGIWCNDSLRGYITGGYQIPNEISGSIIKQCYNGIYTEDANASKYGEYFRISNNTITDCYNCGINSHAGNTSIVNNSVNGNVLGILIYSDGSINGDHGMIVGNTINHNLRAGIFCYKLIRSMIIANNNIWATLGDGTTNGNLGTGYKASSFGIFLQDCTDCTVTGNIFGRNKFNVAFWELYSSVFAHNVLLTDPTNTTNQLVDYTASSAVRYNNIGPNVFSGTFTAGGWNGDVNQALPFTYENGWVNYGAPYPIGSYWRDEQNVVHLSGLIKNGTSGTKAFTLPVEYRPVTGTLQFATVSNGVFGAIAINTAGEAIVTGSTANFSLDGITFKATTS